MKAYMSRKDEYARDEMRSPVSNLKPDVFDGDRDWLESQAVYEARRILAVTEPWRGEAHDACRGEGCPQYRAAKTSLAEALAAFVGEE